jgi:hypothetical protein
MAIVLSIQPLNDFILNWSEVHRDANLVYKNERGQATIT